MPKPFSASSGANDDAELIVIGMTSVRSSQVASIVDVRTWAGVPA